MCNLLESLQAAAFISEKMKLVPTELTIGTCNDWYI